MAKSEHISRVNQLDAYLLDKEILKIVQEQLNNAYKELPPGLLSKYNTEIELLLKTFIWLNSIYRSNSTFGQQVLAITYESEKITNKKLILHFLITILGPYTRENCHLRLTNFIIVQKVLSWLEFWIKLFSIINFFRFLKTGKYPSLLDYILRWNHTSKTGAQMRNIGYEYMNRELLWTGFLVGVFFQNMYHRTFF
jgi:peroxin-2